MAQAPDEPDWSIWSRADAVDLQDAVALSIDLGPGGQRHQYAKSGGKLYRPAEPDRDNYHERLTLSLSHLGRELPLSDPRLTPSVPPEISKVRLVDFAAFASKRDWDLPDEFPGKKLVFVSDDGRSEAEGTVIDGKRMVRTPAGGYITEEQWRAMTTEHFPPPPVPLVPSTKPVNWRDWGHRDRAELWQVVAVSSDLAPENVHPVDARDTFPEEFAKRLSEAMKFAGGPKLPIEEVATWAAPQNEHDVAMQIMAGPPPGEYQIVSLTAFADLADEMGWDLPSRFPRLPRDPGQDRAPPTAAPGPSPKNPEAGERPMDTREQNKLLTMIAAMAEACYAGSSLDQKALEIVDDAKKIGLGLDKRTALKYLEMAEKYRIGRTSSKG